MKKVLTIDGKEVPFKASALIPRIYRFRFGRDMIRDMNTLMKAYNKVKALPEGATEEDKREAQFSVLDLTIFENASYIMARHANPDIPDSIEEWLDGFETFSIYEIMPHIAELWNLQQKTTSSPKKN